LCKSALNVRKKAPTAIPEVLTSQETPKVDSYGIDDDEEVNDGANDEANDAEARDGG
jgi:hypothetical protein